MESIARLVICQWRISSRVPAMQIFTGFGFEDLPSGLTGNVPIVWPLPIHALHSHAQRS